LEISHLSFTPLRVPLSGSDDRGRLAITLHPNPYDLTAVEVYDRPDALTSLLSSSQPVHLLTEEFLTRRQAGTFAGALSDLPGVTSMQLGVGIAKPVIRGMSFNRILVNNRGIKQEGQQWGADHGLEVDPFDVSRVEVIKGPASLLYGSDGLGGVINILPETFGSENGDWLDLTTGYQSNNHAFSSSAAWRGRKRQWIYSARVTHQDYGDYGVPADEFVYAGFTLPIYDNRLKNTAGRELHYSAMVGREAENYRSTLRFSAFSQEAGIFTGAIGIPRSYNLRHEGRHRDIDFPRQRNRHLMLVNNNRFDWDKSSLELDLGVQWNGRKELSFPGAHGIDASVADSDLALGLDLTTYTANAQYTIDVTESYQLLFGAQLQHGENRRSGFEFLLPDYRSNQIGLFSYHRWNLADRWIVNAGLRYDRGRHTVRRHLQPLYDRNTKLPTGEWTERTPAFDRSFGNLSGAAGLSFLPDDRHNLKLNLGNSFRLPTVIELGSNGVHHGNFRHELGDSELGIERGYQIDLTYGYQGRRLDVELSAFYAYYRQYIYLSPSGRFSDLPAGGSLWQYRQDDALFNGLEFMAGYQLPLNLKLSAVGEFVQNLNLDTRLPLPLTPAATLRTELEYGGLTDTYLFLAAETILAQNRVDRNERTTPGAFLINIGFGTQLKLGKRRLHLSARLDNLLNTPYFNHISRYRLINLPEQGRNLVVSAKIPLYTNI
jgi:iron complex outermembrane receptor protein